MSFPTSTHKLSLLDLCDDTLHNIFLMLLQLQVAFKRPLPEVDKEDIVKVQYPTVGFRVAGRRFRKLMPADEMRARVMCSLLEIRASYFYHVIDCSMAVMRDHNVLGTRHTPSWFKVFELKMGRYWMTWAVHVKDSALLNVELFVRFFRNGKPQNFTSTDKLPVCFYALKIQKERNWLMQVGLKLWIKQNKQRFVQHLHAMFARIDAPRLEFPLELEDIVCQRDDHCMTTVHLLK